MAEKKVGRDVYETALDDPYDTIFAPDAEEMPIATRTAAWLAAMYGGARFGGKLERMARKAGLRAVREGGPGFLGGFVGASIGGQSMGRAIGADRKERAALAESRNKRRK